MLRDVGSLEAKKIAKGAKICPWIRIHSFKPNFTKHCFLVLNAGESFYFTQAKGPPSFRSVIVVVGQWNHLLVLLGCFCGWMLSGRDLARIWRVQSAFLAQCRTVATWICTTRSSWIVWYAVRPTEVEWRLR